MRRVLLGLTFFAATSCGGSTPWGRCPPVLDRPPPGTYPALETPDRFRYEVKLDRLDVDETGSVAATFTYLGRTVVQRYRVRSP